MYYFPIIFCLFNFVIAAVIPGEKDATILSDRYKQFGKGEYEFSYNTSNGITRKETAKLVNAGQDNEHIEVSGYYGYTDPDGNLRLFQYTADANGFHIKPQVSGQPDKPVQQVPGNFSFFSGALPYAVLQSLVGG